MQILCTPALLPLHSVAGKYREGDESTIDPAPSAVCTNFASAVELITSSLR